MGKRQIGELQPSELVITLLFSELASIPVQDIDMPLLYGIIPILALAALEILISSLTLKSTTLRKFIYGKPIILVDSSDSRGAGSTADSAAVLKELLPYCDRLRAAVGLSDAPAVEKAFSLEVGAVADFMLGATIAPELSSPVEVKNATVKSLHEGHFYSLSSISRGARVYCGKVAVLEVGKILIQLSSNSRAEGDIGFYRGFGIEPELCDLVSVKACTSFRAGYEPIAAEILNTATPGAAGTVLTELPFKHRPTPLYPFEEITAADISAPKCYR
jgi:microcystin degradation protein MlrC